MQWKIERSVTGSVRQINDEHGRAVCYGDIPEPHAHLIAAAPELLEAAICLRKYLTLFVGPDDEVAKEAFNVADAAIAKARGGENTPA